MSAKKLNVLTGISGMAAEWRRWAVMENGIDFRKEKELALKCTMAFAAAQLKKYLEASIEGLEVAIADEIIENELYIRLEVADIDDGGGYHTCKEENGMVICGHGRNGLLSGIYDTLKEQGWRWTEPGKNGETSPVNATLDFLTAAPKEVHPSYRYRMIDQYRDSDASIELLEWFAKNHINVVQYKASASKYADKLGMLSRKGGHLLHNFLWPDAPFDDGRKVFEVHPEWYGLPENGQREEKTAADIQPCFSNEDLLLWLSQRICKLLQTEMQDVDMLDLWGFDTLGITCSCPHCKEIGNGSDQFLHFLDYVQHYLNENLGRHVVLNTIAYGPTCTIEGPLHGTPEHLAASDSYIIFYPIARCYRHLLGDEHCEANRQYHESLQAWKKGAPGMSLWAGEYYNVSLFEDLPLVFGRLIADEMKYYHDSGCRGATYMHNLGLNWGVRSLTQMLHTQYAWNVNTDYEEFTADYFAARYGRYATECRQLYDMVEEAFKDIYSWRGFSNGRSVLFQLNRWNVKEPAQEIIPPHFESEDEAVQEIKRCSTLLETAVARLRSLLKQEQARLSSEIPDAQDNSIWKGHNCYTIEYRLGEALRGLIYGRDSMALYAAVLEYHNLLRHQQNADKNWELIKEISSRMEEYFVPIFYEFGCPGVHILDALTRTRIKDVIMRCEAQRKNRQ